MSTRTLAHQVVPGAAGAESATADDGAVRPRDSWFHWCATLDALRRSDSKSERQAILGAYFDAVAIESIAPAARYFTGKFFDVEAGDAAAIAAPVVMDAMRALASIDTDELRDRAEKLGDLGCVAGEVFAGRLPSGVSMSEVAGWGEDLGVADRADTKESLVQDMLARLSSLEARYLVNLIMGELSTGIDEATLAVARQARSRASGLGTRH
jgi:hypothetical protein